MITAESMQRDAALVAILTHYTQPAYKYKVSELTELQRQHMAFLLDHSTTCGLLTANHIARMGGDWGAKTLMDVFKPFINGSDKHCTTAAKSLAFKVLKFDNFGTLVLKTV